MKIYLYEKTKIINFVLPSKKIGNFWLVDENDKNLVNINGEDGKWVLTGNTNVSIVGYIENAKVVLKPGTYYVVTREQEKKLIYVSNYVDNSYIGFDMLPNTTIKIGKDGASDIVLKNPYIQDEHLALSFENNVWNLAIADNSIVFINNKLLTQKNIVLKSGTIIDIYGTKILLTYGRLFINNPQNNLTNSNKLVKCDFSTRDQVADEEIENNSMYTDADYYLRSPRMRKYIKPYEVTIDSPPTPPSVGRTPMAMTIIPMLTTCASTVITLTTTVQNITNKTVTFKSQIPSLIIITLMIFTTMLWPIFTRKFEEKQVNKTKEEQTNKYKKYLSEKELDISTEFANQKKTLEENMLSPNICYDVIVNKRRTLWERKIDQNDFLEVRIGTGDVPFNAKINYKSQDFKIEEDDLRKLVLELIEKYKTLNNVPVSYSFLDKRLTAVNGIYPKYIKFMNNVILQLMSYHSYDNLKFIILTNESNKEKWEYLKETPYCFSDDKSIRFFAPNVSDMQEISSYLEKVHQTRVQLSNGQPLEPAEYKTHYIIITDDIDKSRRIRIIDEVLKDKMNYGFSLICIEEKLSKIPSEINSFITIGDTASALISTQDNEQEKFKDEVSDEYDMEMCAKVLSNLPLYMMDKITELPSTVTFLEMFGVGRIDQLNILNRWKNNDPTTSLKTQIGVNENLDTFMLDLHEKQHGPHGLIAGMTGSGKSEFIITFILSMAVNYSPEEVAFVLIDYKGGGLAGAFESNELGMKLPHVVGTITNLDKAEINRALSSIKSELRRRQEKFNEVKTQIGESTIDIYKYQKLYREGVIDEPIPHLIIVCDEFAELKSQQPEFMEDLVSTARIGRSLGVHLILATQKPSGVVDAQIWSNAKFKVCLKVQDKQDSMEMIKNDLAAELKQTGRFYLQVGYNEYFAMGQAAWAGAQYFPSNEYKKNVDKNIYLIDNVGTIRKTINNSSRKQTKSEGEELTNIVRYLISTGKQMSLKLRPLWLDKIPAKILISNLISKYSYNKEPYVINPVIGEYDDPSNQRQGLLTLPISEEGSVIVYGNGDSGKDEFVSSLAYSLMTTYDTSELNLYLMDFGGETLLNYKGAPQVGDVIVNGEDEKIENLAKLLNTEMNKRKKLFMEYNGNYNDYIKLSNQKLPNILIIINSIEILTDIYQDYADKIISVIREGSKYGINFLFTTTNQSTIKFKIAQACKSVLCLQMNQPTDYRDILGRTNGIIPSSYIGRGLIRLENICEFQTASITDDDTSYQTIKSMIEMLNNSGMDTAPSIPVMPELITVETLATAFKDISSVPVGISKESLNICKVDFAKNAFNIITANELEATKTFGGKFLRILESNPSVNKLVIDACNYFEEFNYNIKLVNNNFDSIIDALKSYDDKIQNVLKENNMNIRSLKGVTNTVVIVFGFEKFLSKLDDTHKQEFFDILSHNKEALKINFIMVDSPAAFKKYEYDEWFKNIVDSDDGIWIGPGVTGQYLIKLSVQLNTLSQITTEYAVVIKNGMPTLVKLINEYK